MRVFKNKALKAACAVFAFSYGVLGVMPSICSDKDSSGTALSGNITNSISEGCISSSLRKTASSSFSKTASSSFSKTSSSFDSNSSNISGTSSNSAFAGNTKQFARSKASKGAEYNSWGVYTLGFNEFAPKLTDYTTTVKVAVIDCGVDMDHPFLKDRLTSDGYDFIDHDYYPNDKDGHGTHVAGIIADCTRGLNVQIMPIRVMSNNYAANCDISVGVEYAVNHGADVINLSLNGAPDIYREDAIQYAVDAGVVVVVSAGNEYDDVKNWGPAQLKDVIVVSNMDEEFYSAWDTNYGSTVDVCAPGVYVYSCWNDGAFEHLSGTSMSAPHISALAAMLLIENPSLTPAQVEKKIKSYAKDLGDDGWDKYYGHGYPDMSEVKVVVPEKVELSKKSASIKVGKSVSLVYSIIPSDTTSDYVSFKSSNSKVATVSTKGKVKGIKAGKATITATTANGLTAKCTVTVTDDSADKQ